MGEKTAGAREGRERQSQEARTEGSPARSQSLEVDSIAVPLFTIRNKNPKNSDCEMSWLVYLEAPQDFYIVLHILIIISRLFIVVKVLLNFCDVKCWTCQRGRNHE